MTELFKWKYLNVYAECLTSDHWLNLLVFYFVDVYVGGKESSDFSSAFLSVVMEF